MLYMFDKNGTGQLKLKLSFLFMFLKIITFFVAVIW